jgi:vacuolar-type H+-ATPase subunit I/STV1
LEETNQLVRELKTDYESKQARYQNITEAIADVKAVLRPVRQAAAAVLPPELFMLDVNYGRLQEKRQQLTRIRAVLDQREQLASDITKIQQEIAEAEATVDLKTSAVDFDSLGDRLRDGMITYLNRIKQLNPNSWLGNAVSVKLGERSLRFRVGESSWKTKLGATQRLYFLFG